MSACHFPSWVNGAIVPAGQPAICAEDLGFQLGRDVIEPFEIGLGGAQPHFGLVAA